MPEKFELSLFVPSLPAGQPRAKATSIGGKSRMYSPTTIGKGIDKRPHPAVEFRHAVRTAVQAALPVGFELLDCPLSVSLTFWFPRTAAQTKKTKPNPPLWKTSKPDRDNLDKSVLDCLTGIVWKDDACVCDGRIRKAVITPEMTAGVEIIIQEATELPQ